MMILPIWMHRLVFIYGTIDSIHFVACIGNKTDMLMVCGWNTGTSDETIKARLFRHSHESIFVAAEKCLCKNYNCHAYMGDLFLCNLCNLMWVSHSNLPAQMCADCIHSKSTLYHPCNILIPFLIASPNSLSFHLVWWMQIISSTFRTHTKHCGVW